MVRWIGWIVEWKCWLIVALDGLLNGWMISLADGKVDYQTVEEKK